ncbi:MAG: SdrD B-like domain-containing protein [Ilumatobacter sp.]
MSVDIGLVAPLELGNRIFIDSDEDGDGDGEEPVPAGVVVNLLDGDGDFVATTTTDADGNYLFTGLDDGEYIVELPASNFADGGPLEGFDPSTGAASSTNPDDDVDDNNDGIGQTDGSIRTGVVTLERGDEPTDDIDGPTTTTDDSSNMTVDIGVVQPLGSIGNRVWVDFDGDGIQDPFEQSVPDATVELLDENGDVIATTTTDDTGLYLFDDLPAGEYRVRVVPTTLPDGSIFAPQNQGTSDDNDSDADTTGTSDIVTLGRGEDIDDVDFGIFQIPGELPSTGGNSLGALRIGLLVLLSGVALVAITWGARRRNNLRTTVS